MAAQKNLAVEVNKIRDEKYKNQLVEKIETYTKDIKYVKTNNYTLSKPEMLFARIDKERFHTFFKYLFHC